MIEGASDDVTEVGSISDELTMLDDALDGLIEDEATMLMAAALLLLLLLLLLILLLRPLFKILALFKLRTLLLLNEGELVCSWTELTGVAIKVGVTSLLVIMATVVLLERLLILLLALSRVLNKLGLITGVNALLDLVKVKVELGATSMASAEDVSSDSSSVELDDKINSSSISLKSNKELLETTSEVKLGVTVTELGANVASTSPDSNSGTVELSSLLINSTSVVDGFNPNVGSSVASIPMPMEVGIILRPSVMVAAKISVLVSSRLVMTVLSPSIEVVQ